MNVQQNTPNGVVWARTQAEAVPNGMSHDTFRIRVVKNVRNYPSTLYSGHPAFFHQEIKLPERKADN